MVTSIIRDPLVSREAASICEGGVMQMNDNSPQQREMNRDQTQDVKKQAPGSGKDERIESKAAVKNGVARMILVVLSILIEVIVIFLLLHYAGSRAGWIYVVLHIISILLGGSQHRNICRIYFACCFFCFF